MAILLRRNDKRDPWFSVHGYSIKEGDIVSLVSLSEDDYFAKKHSGLYPPEIKVNRGIATDPYNYIASLNCFDYVKEKDRG